MGRSPWAPLRRFPVGYEPGGVYRLHRGTLCGPARPCGSRRHYHGLHTLSAVNIAEYAPYLAEAADQYLRAYIDIAKALNAGWVDVHAGYHFTSDVAQRQVAGLERLKRAVGYAEDQGVLLLLENLNWEPEHAEVHYLAHNCCRVPVLFRRD